VGSDHPAVGDHEPPRLVSPCQRQELSVGACVCGTVHTEPLPVGRGRCLVLDEIRAVVGNRRQVGLCAGVAPPADKQDLSGGGEFSVRER
jgi:hypothetical protein